MQHEAIDFFCVLIGTHARIVLCGIANVRLSEGCRAQSLKRLLYTRNPVIGAWSRIACVVDSRTECPARIFQAFLK